MGNGVASIIVAASALFVVSASASASFVQTCEPTIERHAAPILGRDVEGSLSRQEAPYVAGERAFYQEVGKGWWFALLRQEHGWSIRLYDSPLANAVDLSEITPPHHGPTNPRDIFGWHFRNATNTGPNKGEVNAPQEDRLFFFSQSLSGTGGFKPMSAPDPADGLGWLQVVDYGLADLNPDEKARLNYLEFNACISWPKTEEEKQREADDANPIFMDEDIEAFGGCGLDLAMYDLHAAFLPRKLGGDMDGDDSIDEIAQVRRKRDGKRGIALCRAGTWISVLGMDGETIDNVLRPGFFDQMEAWRLVEKDHGKFGFTDEPDWPQADGDILVLERVEKEMILLYWQEGGFKTQQVYRYVEP